MPITILDYVKSVVGDKDLYTAEDCLASGVDILGGCQGCQASIAVYNATRQSGYWRARMHRRERIRHRRRFHRPRRRIVTCPVCGNADTISETRATTGSTPRCMYWNAVIVVREW